ncbi:MAG: TIGR03790 family protein [Chthoniobacteraceae bacterium]|jgi:uncharacterized protein (TIGR03790 family)
MKKGVLAAFVLPVLVLGARADSSSPSPTPSRESAATLVVYNNLDSSSVGLAAYYARRRGIPLDHFVGLNCPATEEISRQQYDTTIAEPLRQIFSRNGWWHASPDPNLPVSDNQIRFVVLMKGIPLKIANEPGYPGDDRHPRQPELDTNAAAVDSELATLGLRTRLISGPLKNPYYRSFTPFMDTPFGPMMLVCRLDGPSDETVMNMIDGAIEAERTGLTGFAYVDMRGITSGPLAMGDQWLSGAADSLRQYGMPVVWDDSPELFPADYPMTHAAVYLGWYAGGVQGPMARQDFRFEPGAIAVHIHSFSAATLRDARADWAAPLLAHGAVATLGNVYEPYLALTPNLDIFIDRLRNGFTFAESAYASQAALSWMTTFVGDPLYRPFPESDDTAEPQARSAIEYAAYRKGAQTWYEQSHAAGAKQLAASARDLRSGIVWEGLGLLQWSAPDYDGALESFRQAEQCYGLSDDALRTILNQCAVLKADGKMAQARAVAAKELPNYEAFDGSALLRAIIGLPPAGNTQ